MRPWCSAWLQHSQRCPRVAGRISGRVHAAQPGTMATTAAPPVATGRLKTYAPTTDWDPAVQAYLEACLGAEALGRISQALTRPPLATCLRVNTLRVTPEELLERLPGALSPEDRALLEASPRQPHVHPEVPGAIMVPGTGPHDIDYSATGGKEVVVGRLAGEAIMRGAHLFVPGLLAVSAGISRGDLVAVSVAVEVSGTAETRKNWGMTKGTVLGVDPEKDAQLPDRSKLYIGVGRAEMSRVEFFRNTAGLAVSMQERVFRTPGCGDILRGQFMLQNLPSLVAAHVLAPQPGQRVLDMCAAPGGKTTAIAQLMGNQGEVIALDRSHAKAREVRELAEELGITIVKAYKMDACKAVLRRGKQQGGGGGSSGERRGGAREPQAAAERDPLAAAVAAAAAAAAGDVGAAAPSGENGAAVEAGSGREGPGCAAAGGSSAASGAGASGGEEISERMRRRIERITAARLKRGQDPGVFAVLPEGKEAVTEGFEPESFDCVLLDAPCSALGLRPRLVHRQTMAELQGTATYQRKLLDTAVQLVKPGGTLVFSTCTINPGENEANVRYTLDTYPFMRLAPQEPRLGGPGLSGEVELPGGGGTLRLLRPEDAALVQRFDPAGPLDTVGFFVSKFVKTASCLGPAQQ